MNYCKFKTRTEPPLSTFISNHLLQTKGKPHLPDSLKSFLSSLSQNFSPITNLNTSSRSPTYLSNSIQSSINYLSLLEPLLLKFPPSHSHLYTFSFTWTDSITSKPITSSNLYLEYFSVMYNIGITYLSLANNIFHENQFQFLSKDISTSTHTHLTTALYYFNTIKTEIGSKLSPDEKGFDLSFDGLDYMKNICIMNCYICLMHISYVNYLQYESECCNEKSEALNMLLLNVKQRISFINEIVLHADNALKYLNEINSAVDVNVTTLITYMQFQRDYYKSLIDYFKYKYYMKLHNIQGNKMGYALTCLTHSINLRRDISQHLQVLQPFVNSNVFLMNLDLDEKQQTQMKKENEILHFPTSPPLLPIERTSIKIEQTVPIINKPNYDQNEISIQLSLDNFLPLECMSIINNITNELTIHITNQLQQCVPEETITNNINNIKLPLCVLVHFNMYTNDDFIKSKELLWKQIAYMQKLNCSKGIENIFEMINNKAKRIVGLLDEVKRSLNEEKESDLKYRKQFGEIKWDIPRSDADSYISHTDKRVNEFKAHCLKNSEFENMFNKDKELLDEVNGTIETIKSKVPGFVNGDEGGNVFSNDEQKIIELFKQVRELKRKYKSVLIKIEHEKSNSEMVVKMFNEGKGDDVDEKAIVQERKQKINELMQSELIPLQNELQLNINELKHLCEKVNGMICNDNDNNSNNHPIFELKQNYIKHYEKITKLFFYYLKQVIKIYHFITKKSNEIYKGLNVIYEYLKGRDMKKRFLLTNTLNQSINEPIFEIQMCLPEQMEPMFYNIYKEISELDIDITNLKSIFEPQHSNNK